MVSCMRSPRTDQPEDDPLNPLPFQSARAEIRDQQSDSAQRECCVRGSPVLLWSPIDNLLECTNQDDCDSEQEANNSPCVAAALETDRANVTAPQSNGSRRVDRYCDCTEHVWSRRRRRNQNVDQVEVRERCR